MPQARHYANAAQRQAAYRQRQVQAHAAQLAQQSLPPLPALPTVPGQARWSALLQPAQWALAQMSQEMQAYYDERSEAWQESERGECFQERLAAVQEVLEGVAELDIADTKKSVKNP
ncbi:MAG: hypothetical protein M3347_15835 [Armatimonadota bacterium]|nr:hypothetical protein [Armatimonadota bacterium]